MEALKIPLWINLASVVLAFILVYLLARFYRETGHSEHKIKPIKAVENSIRGKVLSPEKRRFRKAA
jgi:membrane protein implicated in regulation of membrane protease activity